MRKSRKAYAIMALLILAAALALGASVLAGLAASEAASPAAPPRTAGRRWSSRSRRTRRNGGRLMPWRPRRRTACRRSSLRK